MKSSTSLFCIGLALLTLSFFSVFDTRGQHLNSYIDRICNLEDAVDYANCEQQNQYNLNNTLSQRYRDLMDIKVQSKIQYVQKSTSVTSKRNVVSSINTTLVQHAVSFPNKYFSKNKVQAAINYIDRFKVVAIDEQSKFNIPASITLGQGLLESGIGQSYLARNANNHFGHKYFGKKYVPQQIRYLTDGYVFRHDDCCSSKKCKKPDKFIKFKTAWSSIRAHSYLLQKPRYKKCYQSTDYKQWAYALRKAGYATDKRYAQKLINIIEQFKLYEYDTQNAK